MENSQLSKSSCRSMRLYDQSISLQRCWARENALKSRCNHCLAEKFNRIEMQRHATKKLLGSMTFARRAKECFDSCEQNVWTDMFSCSAMSESNCCECWDKFDSANFVQTFEMSWTSAIWALVKFLRTSLLQRFRMLNWSCLGAGIWENKLEEQKQLSLLILSSYQNGCLTFRI